MAINEITLKVDNNVTYVVGKLDSSTYQQFRSYLGYIPEESFWMLKNSTNEKNQKWKKDWDGRISTVHYSKDYCRCFDKKAGTHFPTGLISKAIKFFNLRKIHVHQVDIRQPVQRTLPLSLSEEVEQREYQQEVVNKACEIDRGIIKVATGGGKTVIASSIIANRGVTPTIFYVPSVDLLAQAKSEIEKFIRYNGLKFSVGQLSSVKKEIGDITVMTNQTAVASLGGKYVSYDDEEKKEVISEELKEMRKDIVDLIRSCKLFIGDEVQHWAAETCQIISDASVSAKYRWGISATPFRDKNDDMLIEGCFGRTIADINASFLIERGYLVKPTIYFLPIDMKINAKNYANVYKHGIVENEERNLKIAKLANIYKEKGNNILILCKHISHGNMLESLIPDSIFLHGEHSAKKRKEHIDKIRLGGSNVTIASVIFDEGIDVRSLDTLILAGSGKSPTRALQRVGRILRPFAGKNQVTVFDFMDKCQYLNEHSLRRKQIYKTEPEFEIITTGL